MRKGLEARFLKKAGYDVAVGVNMYPVLKKWVSALEKEDIRGTRLRPSAVHGKMVVVAQVETV